MTTKHRILLLVDCVVNIVLGVLLLLFPLGLIDRLGLPPATGHFYPSLLGAVILGIGLALFLEVAGFQNDIRGLGLGGAIVINVIGALVLICWLVFGGLEIPLRGRIILWIVGLLVLLIGIAELAARSWTYGGKIST